MNESIVQLNQMEYIPAFESRIEEHFQYTEDIYGRAPDQCGEVM